MKKKLLKKQYDPAKMEIAFIENADVVTASGGDVTDTDAPDIGDIGDWGAF